MNRFRRTVIACATSLGITLAGAAGARTALAATSAPSAPRGCPPTDWNFETFKPHRYFIPKRTGFGKVQVLVPGEAVVWTESKNTTIYGEVTATGSYNLNDLISKAEAQINAKISYSTSSSTTQTITYTEPRNWPEGWFGEGAWGYEFNWQAGHYTNGCKYLMNHGTAKLPASKPGFGHGEGLPPS